MESEGILLFPLLFHLKMMILKQDVWEGKYDQNIICIC